MKILIGLLALLVYLTACKSQQHPVNSRHYGNDCKTYFDFLQSNWSKTDNFYQFKGSPEYWLDYPQYGRFECLMEMSKSELQHLLGPPTKVFILPKVEIWIYCLSEECTVNFLEYKNPKEWVFYFHKAGDIANIYFRPTFEG